MVRHPSEGTLDYQDALRRVILDRMRRAVLSNTRLAELAEMHPDYIGHVLASRRPVTSELMARLAPHLGTTCSQLHRETLAICS